MKLLKFRTERTHGGRRFSRWVPPTMRRYMMACCDCGLVHEMQFRVVEILGRTHEDGRKWVRVAPRRFQVQFRARRSEGYTQQQRKPMIKDGRIREGKKS